MTDNRVTFSTSAVHRRDRFSLWHDVARKAYADHECQAANPAKFDASIEALAVADAQLSVYSNSPMVVWRTPRQIERAPSDKLFICVQLENTCGISQLGREVTLEAGDFCIIDTRRPYRYVYPAASRQLILAVPRTEMERRLGTTDSLTALCMRPDREIGGLASSFIRMLPDYAPGLSDLAGIQVVNQAIDLVGLALAKRAGLSDAKMSSAATLSLHRLNLAIENSLTDRSCNCEAVAAKAGMSLRYANALLAREGSSLERRIQRRRLENCKRALDDQTSMRSIGEIAYVWGFTNASHFSKAFRIAFGQTPRDYRRGTRECP